MSRKRRFHETTRGYTSTPSQSPTAASVLGPSRRGHGQGQGQGPPPPPPPRRGRGRGRRSVQPARARHLHLLQAANSLALSCPRAAQWLASQVLEEGRSFHPYTGDSSSDSDSPSLSDTESNMSSSNLLHHHRQEEEEEEDTTSTIQVSAQACEKCALVLIPGINCRVRIQRVSEKERYKRWRKRRALGGNRSSSSRRHGNSRRLSSGSASSTLAPDDEQIGVSELVQTCSGCGHSNRKAAHTVKEIRRRRNLRKVKLAQKQEASRALGARKIQMQQAMALQQHSVSSLRRQSAGGGLAAMAAAQKHASDRKANSTSSTLQPGKKSMFYKFQASSTSGSSKYGFGGSSSSNSSSQQSQPVGHKFSASVASSSAGSRLSASQKRRRRKSKGKLADAVQSQQDAKKTGSASLYSLLNSFERQ